MDSNNSSTVLLAALGFLAFVSLTLVMVNPPQLGVTMGRDMVRITEPPTNEGKYEKPDATLREGTGGLQYLV